MFRGIPYAEPPIGVRRWQSPEPKGNWSGVLPVTSDGAGCPQICKLPTLTCPPTTDESCLFLNVFASEGLSSTAKRPVLFFIHGGNFYQGYGGGLLYDGTKFVLEHDVVVVSINYRLGALGFLYSGSDPTSQITGNFGLHDQRLALEWVQANIAAFGGDPRQVTIFGQSAGAMSVASHLLMPGSKGLFAGAILQSHPLGLPWRTTKDYSGFSEKVAKEAGCARQLSRSPWEPCLRNTTWQSLLVAQEAAETSLLAEISHVLELFIPFSPVVGTEELPQQPLTAFLEGKAHDVPIVIGTVAEECMEFIYSAFGSKLSALEEDALFDVIFGLSHGSRVLKEYPRPAAARTAGDMRNHSANATTDAFFHCATRRAALGLSQQNLNGTRKSQTFVYHFDHVISYGDKFWLPDAPECIDRVCHGEDLPFVFYPNTSSINGSFTVPEMAMSNLMQQYWGAFAHKGSPGASGGASPLSWVPFNASSEAAMVFSTAPQSNLQHASYRAKCAIWDSFDYDWLPGRR